MPDLTTQEMRTRFKMPNGSWSTPVVTQRNAGETEEEFRARHRQRVRDAMAQYDWTQTSQFELETQFTLPEGDWSEPVSTTSNSGETLAECQERHFNEVAEAMDEYHWE